MYLNYRPQWVWGQRLIPVFLYRNMSLRHTQIRLTEPFDKRSLRLRVSWLIPCFYSVGMLVAALPSEQRMHLLIAKFYSSIRNRVRPWIAHSAARGAPRSPPRIGGLQEASNWPFRKGTETQLKQRRSPSGGCMETTGKLWTLSLSAVASGI